MFKIVLALCLSLLVAVVFVANAEAHDTGAPHMHADAYGCAAVSGIVDSIDGTTAVLALPWGGTARVSLLCLPDGVSVGTVIVRGAPDARATRREQARPERMIKAIRRMGPRRPIVLGWLDRI